jgi:hypothetical protein
VGYGLLNILSAKVLKQLPSRLDKQVVDVVEAAPVWVCLRSNSQISRVLRHRKNNSYLSALVKPSERKVYAILASIRR